MPTAQTCLVSFIDTNNIRHAVEVAASTLYEAATLAMAEFRRCKFTENAPGPARRLTVTVKGPSTSHEVQWGKVETWIQSAGKPNEQDDEEPAAAVALQLINCFFSVTVSVRKTKLNDSCSVTLKGGWVERDAHAGRVVQVKHAFLDARFPVVEFKPEWIAIRVRK